MKLFKRSIELVVIRDIFNPPILDDKGKPIFETYRGQDLEKLLKQAFGNKGLSDSVRLYHGDLCKDITPKTPQDVDKVMRLHGRIYAVVKPMGIGAYIAAVVVSTLVSLAMAFLMPVPAMPNARNQPPSPNNALAARTNQQRLGGRIPDIFGTVWSVPDLIAPVYSVYVDHQEVEYSYMCVGRGSYNVDRALDDTTPINQVAGSGVLIYDPHTGLDDAPIKAFGEQFNPSEAEFARLAAKRYTSVNGQDLTPSNEFTQGVNVQFKAPNIIISSYIASRWSPGRPLNIESADIINAIPPEPTENNPNPIVNSYNFNGLYEIESVNGDEITLLNPETANSQWLDFASNDTLTDIAAVDISAQSETYWQGWFYTNDKSHTNAYINIIAPNGIFLFRGGSGKYFGKSVDLFIESESVDIQGNPINGTRYTQELVIKGRTDGNPDPYLGYGTSSIEKHEQETRSTAAMTFDIENPNLLSGYNIRLRVSRGVKLSSPVDGDSVTDNIKLSDFYSYRVMSGNDYPSGVTTVYTKTLATEGALSLKERKLRLLVQRYVTDATSGLLKLSNRADDIIRHIATDPKIGNLQLSQVDIAQIKSEIDAQVAYFGTGKCSEFCYTFDDNNLSAEETLQTVGKAVFSQAKRQGNKIMLDFERIVPASVAVFNSHNILPDTFTASESLGIANDYDGVTVEYTDPADDATVTLSYPEYSLVNPHEDKLIGVRNEVQAHIHMMRLYNKDRHAYKTCEFTAGDESNIVVRTNRITVADQLRANIQQGSVDSIETVGSDIVLYTTDPVSIEPSVPHTLFIQTINNGVEAIEVTARDDYSVKLARLPSGEISGTDKVVQAVYQIVSENDDNRDAYLVAQKDPSDGMTNKLLCTNYDDRYYQNDSDFTNGLIA